MLREAPPRVRTRNPAAPALLEAPAPQCEVRASRFPGSWESDLRLVPGARPSACTALVTPGAPARLYPFYLAFNPRCRRAHDAPSHLRTNAASSLDRKSTR